MNKCKKILVWGLVALWLTSAFAVTATAEYDPISPAPSTPSDEEQTVIEDLDALFPDTEQDDKEYLETLTPEEEMVTDGTADTTPSETIPTTTTTTAATTTTTGAAEGGATVPLNSMFFFSAVALLIFIAGGVAIYVIAKRQVNLRQH